LLDEEQLDTRAMRPSAYGFVPADRDQSPPVFKIEKSTS
jgi:hypothetical protein